MTVKVDVSTREVEKVVKSTEKVVTLVLDEETAVAIAVLTGTFTAYPANPERKLTSPVFNALNDAGYGLGNKDYHKFRNRIKPAMSADYRYFI